MALIGDDLIRKYFELVPTVGRHLRKAALKLKLESSCFLSICLTVLPPASIEQRKNAGLEFTKPLARYLQNR